MECLVQFESTVFHFDYTVNPPNDSVQRLCLLFPHKTWLLQTASLGASTKLVAGSRQADIALARILLNRDLKREGKQMRENIEDNPLGQTAKGQRSHAGSRLLGSVKARWSTYWKAALAVLILVPLALFAAQNTSAIDVRFLTWETEVSLTLLVLLALLSGAFIGQVVDRVRRRRSRATSR
jgi:uncharacterized integral membrane protein